MWSYRSRLERDLERWRALGWLTPDGDVGIRAELAKSTTGIGLSSVLAVLAATLLGFAAMTFVAAHWDGMPRALKLSMLIGLLWAAYAAAGFFAGRGQTWIADAAVLFAVSIFGANIMLIAQMFHIEGNPPDAVLVWAIGALAAGALIPSMPALGLAMLLVGLWGGWETVNRDAIYWPFLIGWAGVTSAYIFHSWSPGKHFSGIAAAIWVIVLGPYLQEWGGFKISLVIGATIMLAGAIIETIPGLASLTLKAMARPLFAYGWIIAGAAVFALQFFDNAQPGELLLWAIVAFLLSIGSVAWGFRSGNGAAVWLGYIGFAAEILGLYFKTLGTLLDTSTFFLVTGLLVLALAYVAYRLHVRAMPSQKTQEGTAA